MFLACKTDIIVEHDGQVEPIEVKSGKHYKSHAALNNLIGNEDFKIAKASVLSNGNYSKEGKIEYMPIYFAMFLKKDALPETLTYEQKI